MNNHFDQRLTTIVLAACLSMTAGNHAHSQVQGGIPAFLPHADEVAPSQAMPIDGVWRIDVLSKRIRIEEGRAFAVDPWTHMFVLNIAPDMVVLQDFTPTGPGKYTAHDLPLMSTGSFEVTADRSLQATIPGMLGPIKYKLIPVQIDDPEWYDQEMAAAGFNPTGNSPGYRFGPRPGDGDSNPPGYRPAPPADDYEPAPNIECEVEQFDPRTGNTTCLD